MTRICIYTVLGLHGLELLGRNKISINSTPRDHPSTLYSPLVEYLGFQSALAPRLPLQISQYIHTWTINLDLGSDHVNIGIILTIPITNNRCHLVIDKPILQWSKANWSIFADIIHKSSQDLSKLNSREETLRATTNTITIIRKAIDAAVQVITPKN
jgi:hypothetical protein